MSGLEFPGLFIAVISLTGKVFALCYQYADDVSSARDDIKRLANEVRQLEAILLAAKDLVEGDKGKNLAASASKGLIEYCGECEVTLNNMVQKLEPSKKGEMSRFGTRALTWPLKSKHVSEIIESLSRYRGNILAALQIDQT
jgi:hypothetical protein